MPIARPDEKAYTATSSRWDTLKRRSQSAKRRASAGLPCAPYTSSTHSGRSPNRAASSCRNRARARMNRRASRSKANRVARCRSASESTPADARTVSGAAASPVTTTSIASSVKNVAPSDQAPSARSPSVSAQFASTSLPFLDGGTSTPTACIVGARSGLASVSDRGCSLHATGRCCLTQASRHRNARRLPLGARGLLVVIGVRLLHVLAPGAVGGLERVVQLLAHGQARAGDDVHVAAVLDQAHAGHPLLDALAAGGVTTHVIVLPGRRYWRERAAILELGGRLRPVVVHTHGYRPDVVDAAAARRLGIPTVTTVHGFTGGDWKNRLYERLQRRAHRRFDAVVAVSRPLVEQLIESGVPAHRVHLVQNAWQETAPPLDHPAARRALGLREDGFLIGWVGRLSSEKRPDLLLDALVHLTDLPVTGSVIGNGPEHRSLAARARRLGVERLVRWHGTVPDAGRCFAAF